MRTLESVHSVVCPNCHTTLTMGDGHWHCGNCSFQVPGDSSYIAMEGSGSEQQTADHYTLQWGGKLGFLEFIKSRPQAKNVFAAARLGWNSLFSHIREDSKTRQISVYDAACGFGGIAAELIDDSTVEGLTYVGADIHSELRIIAQQIPLFERCGLLLQWDITRPLPVSGTFDYVLCRAAMHHTPDPRQTFATLRQAVKPGGILALSVYRKKAICREAADDALRDVISHMSPQQAFEVSRQFTVLGKALQKLEVTVDIPEDLPILGIQSGSHDIQTLIYYHFLKCFYNPEFGDEYSTLVNYDWYHPQYAYRFEASEVRNWLQESGFEIVEETTSEAQHYYVGRLKDQGPSRVGK